MGERLAGKGQMCGTEMEKERQAEGVAKQAEKVMEVEKWKCGIQRNSKDSGRGTGLEREDGEDFRCKPVVGLKIVLMIYV